MERTRYWKHDRDYWLARTGNVSWALLSACLALAIGSVSVLHTNATVVLIIAAIAVTITILCLRNIYLAWTLYFASICANGLLFSAGPLTMRPEYITTPILLLALILNNKISVKPNRAVLFGSIGWFLAASASSYYVALDSGASLRMLAQLVVAIVPVFLLSNARLDTHLLVKIGTAVLSTICTVSLLVWIPVRDFRIAALAFEPNVMGSLTIGWICVVAYYAMERHSITTRHALLTIPIVLVLLLTVTRAAWVALALVLISILFYNTFRRPILLISTLILILIAGYYTLDSGATSTDEESWQWRVLHIFDLISGTGGYRVEIWRVAIAEISERDLGSLIGTGLNSFSQYHLVDPTRVSSSYLSSLWIGLVYDSGWFGLISFALLVGGLLFAIANRLLAIPLFLALAVCASFTNIVWFAFPWVFIALLINKSHEDPSQEGQLSTADNLKTTPTVNTKLLADGRVIQGSELHRPSQNSVEKATR